MPVLKCGNGKYRIGKGPCMYTSKASAERAYKGYLGHKYGEAVTEAQNRKDNKGECMNKVQELVKLLEDDGKDILDKVYDEIYKDFMEKLAKLKSYVDGIGHRTSKKNIDNMINDVSDVLANFSREFKNL